jgi:hypothetical protein
MNIINNDVPVDRNNRKAKLRRRKHQSADSPVVAPNVIPSLSANNNNNNGNGNNINHSNKNNNSNSKKNKNNSKNNSNNGNNNNPSPTPAPTPVPNAKTNEPTPAPNPDPTTAISGSTSGVCVLPSVLLAAGQQLSPELLKEIEEADKVLDSPFLKFARARPAEYLKLVGHLFVWSEMIAMLTPTVAIGLQWVTALCDGPAILSIIELIILVWNCLTKGICDFENSSHCILKHRL